MPKSNKDTLTELEYYQQLDDYENLQDYIDIDPPGYEPEFDVPQFKPNYNNAVVVDGLPIVVNREKLGNNTNTTITIIIIIITIIITNVIILFVSNIITKNTRTLYTNR